MFRPFLPLLALPLLAAVAPAADDDAVFARLAPIGTAEKVFVGKLSKVTDGPTALSNPPIYSWTFEFEVGDSLRGDKPDAKSYRYSFRGNNPPKYGVGTAYIVGAKKSGDAWTVVMLDVDGEAERKVVKQLLSIPAGWTFKDGKAVSPWGAWPKDGPKLGDSVCSKSGRPALLCGEGIEVKVEQVPAKNPQQFKNDMYGDGTFKISVKNTTKKDATVPAVLTNGKDILWGDSVLFLSNGKPLVLPTAGKITKDTKPLALKAGEEVSGEVNSLVLGGIEWPTGGQRVYFDIAIGEKASNNFFYYHYKVHDELREAAVKELKK